MSSGSTLYSVRIPYPEILTLGQDNPVALEVSRDGAAVAPTSGTFTLRAPGGASIIDAQPVVITGGRATFSIGAAFLQEGASNVTLSEGYQIVWSLVVDGETLTRDRPAAVARRPISPALAVQDLLDEYAELDRLKGAIDLQALLDAAWGDIVRRWIREGGLTYQVKTPGAFFEAHRELALMRFWRNLAAARPGSDQYQTLVEHHKGQYEAAWAAVNVQLDLDNDGRPDDVTSRARRGAVLQPNTPPPSSRSHRFRGRMIFKGGKYSL